MNGNEAVHKEGRKNMIKICFNGIKATSAENKIQKAYYFKNEDGSISVNAENYLGFSKEVHTIFNVKNETDIQTDYFEKDRFKVLPSNPYYNDFVIAMKQVEARRIARQVKRNTKHT